MPDLETIRNGYDPLITAADWEDSDDIAEAVADAAFAAIAPHYAALQAEVARLREAAELTVLNFRRNQASGNFQGDDEHEAWTALNRALRGLEEHPQ